MPVDPFTIDIIIDAPEDFQQTYSYIDTRFKEGDANSKNMRKHISNIPVDYRKYRVNGLRPGRTYTFDFVGKTKDGSNNALATLTMTTPSGGS